MLDDLIFFTKINEFIKNRAIFLSIFTLFFVENRWISIIFEDPSLTIEK